MGFGGLRARTRDAAPVEGLFATRGRYVHRSRTGRLPSYRVLPFELPPGVRRVADTRFLVDVDHISTYCGFSLVDGGWHPFLELLREYERDSGLRYEDSVLCRLYERFTPATVGAAIFPSSEDPPAPLDRMPAEHEVMKRLWQLDRRAVGALTAQAPYTPILDGHTRYFGPKTPAAGTEHFDRVIDLYESVRRHGYDPARFGGGRPRGYFLVRGDDYRFVISRGNHRVPALRLLGVRQIVATCRVHHPPVVDERQLRRWTIDEGGAYPRATAEALFDAMFSTTGRERAQELGLSEGTT
jgi:hypothetical protein